MLKEGESVEPHHRIPLLFFWHVHSELKSRPAVFSLRKQMTVSFLAFVTKQTGTVKSRNVTTEFGSIISLLHCMTMKGANKTIFHF